MFVEKTLAVEITITAEKTQAVSFRQLNFELTNI